MKKLVMTSSLFQGPLMAYRLKVALPYFVPRTRALARWLFKSRELANFTYDLTDLNKQYLVNFLSFATNTSASELEGYMRELESDEQLREHISTRIRASSYRNVSDEHACYGRRLGWYMLARTIKPRVIVETGVDKGLGSCVLAAALLRNASDGKPGRYYGTDIDPAAGFLLGPPYDAYATLLYGDSIESLKALDCTVDMFINDSDHSAEYEEREYETILPKLSDQPYLVGDNAHCTDKLSRFAAQHGFVMLYFQEQPKAHWYPGAGIGLAFRRTTGEQAAQQ